MRDQVSSIECQWFSPVGSAFFHFQKLFVNGLLCMVSLNYFWFCVLFQVQTALVKICIRPSAEKEVEDVNDDPGWF